MAAYTLKMVQKIPASLQTVWDLFSNPDNLKAITPPNLGFRIISTEMSPVIYPGQLIEYRIKPLPGVPVYWRTLIVEVKEGEYFMDTQQQGPYKLWEHRHYFSAIDGGVEMTDIVTYINPLGILGHIANALFVKRKLRKIFEYRFQKTEELLGKWEGQKCNVNNFKC